MNWWQKLSHLGECREHEPLAPRTTMGTGGTARWFFTPYHVQELIKGIAMIPQNIAIIVLGRGSNVLVPDDGIDGLIMDLTMLQNVSITDHSLSAQAGTRMPKLAQIAANHQLHGLEFMATVPGDLGGGIAMNAGAFEQQVSDTLLCIDIVHRDGSTQTLPRNALHMHYRYTELPPASIVTSATFSLKDDSKGAIKKRMRNMRAKRSATQPLAQPNCGSVFKNPADHYAAQLIEACGLKGKQIGQAMISDKHANFIVNLGQASTDDVRALIALAREQVEHKFSIVLEPEVKLLGGVL